MTWKDKKPPMFNLFCDSGMILYVTVLSLLLNSLSSVTSSPINRRYLMAKGLDKKKNVKKKGKTLKEKRAAKKEKKRSFQVK